MSVFGKCLNNIQDNINVLTYPYLRKYLQWAKLAGIPFYGDYLHHRLTTLGNLYNVIKIHPFASPIMYGGDPKTVEKLNRIYNFIKSMKTQQIQLRSDDLKEVDELLRQIEEKIKNVDVNESGVPKNKILVGNTLIDADMIQSTIKTIKLGLQNMNQINMIEEYDKIPSQVPQVNYKELKIKELLQHFQEKIQKIDTTIDEQLRQTQIAQLQEEFNKLESDIKKQMQEMEQAIVDVEKTIKDVNDSLGYTFNENEFVLVPEFEQFLDELLNIKNIPVEFKNIIERIKNLSKTKDLNECVELFNNDVIPYVNIVKENTKYKNFVKYYNGINNVKINNMFFATKGLVNFQAIRDLISTDVNTDLKMNYTNDEQFMDSFFQYPQPQKGGDLESLKNSMKANGDFLIILQKYNTLRNKYNKGINEYQTLLLEQFMHNIFLVMIVTNQLVVSGYVIHEYIQRGSLTLYNRILKNMVSSMEKNPNVRLNKYLSKYHRVTIYKLLNFTNVLIEHLNERKNIKVQNCVVQQCEPPPSGMTQQECFIKRKKCLEDDIIDINACSGETANRFLLLNYFKDIMAQYNVLSGSKISIYARINDLGKPMTPNMANSCNELMYLSNFDKKLRGNTCGKMEPIDKIDIQELDINYGVCRSFEKKEEMPNSIKFTEVFDSTQFPTCTDISKYMSINTLLEQGNGIGIMTYGYSGTGKSFSLFGNTSKNISGILQSTLNDMNNLKGVEFRIMELYGFGMPYPYYWELGTKNIEHKLFEYKLNVDGNGRMNISTTNIIKADKIEDYMNCKNEFGQTYLNIPENYVSEIFKNFESFVTSVDNEREKNLRIRDTPNNVVSSRSVIIYDFQIKISENKKVPFIIIDLPGREEILQTYVEPYINSPSINNLLGLDENKKNELKLLLSFMAINPLGIPIFAENIVCDTIINKIKKNKTIKEQIMGKLHNTFYIRKNKDDTNQLRRIQNHFKTDDGYIVSDQGNKYAIEGDFNLMDEFINQAEAKSKNPDGSDKLLGHSQTLKAWFDYKESESTIEMKSGAQGFGYTAKRQIQMVLGIHLINRVIMTKNFDLLKEIIEKICYEKINNVINDKIKNMKEPDRRQLVDALYNEKFKALYWYKNRESINEIVNDTTKLQNVLSYNYYLTPYEGLYINENIIGFIKYLSLKKILDNEEETPENIAKANEEIQEVIKKQDATLSFTYQQKMVRMLIMTQNEKTRQDIANFFNIQIDEVPTDKIYVKDGKDIKYNYGIFEELYNKLKTTYQSDKIFNFNKPLITEILEPYMKRLFGYNVLYLLANYKDDSIRESRCGHQQKLLQNTLDFINVIANV
jgi:hypothetical protein